MEKNKEKDNKAWWHEGITAFAQASGWIAGPIVIALFLGKWLDGRFNTGSRYFYICIAVAFVISNVGMALEVIKYSKKLKKIDKKIDQQDKQD